MKVVVISTSPRKNSITQHAMKFVFEYTKTKEVEVDFINLSEDRVECFRGSEEEYNQVTKSAAHKIMESDVWLIGTPIYNSFFSSALKNLFEYVSYKKTHGKVAGMVIMASGNIGFIDVQTLLTQLLSYFRVITNPKAVFLTIDSVSNNKISDESAKKRLIEMVDETLKISFKLKS
jgi:FMN reductase